MALYIAKVTVPPNTPETNPVEIKVPVEGRYLEKIEYRFPAGCFEAVKVRVMYGNRVISPKGRLRWIDGENEKIEDYVEWPLPSYRCTLTIQAYSEAEDYEHTITVRFVVRHRIPREIFEEIGLLLRAILARFKLLAGI